MFEYIFKSFNVAAVSYYPTTTAELTLSVRINISHENNKKTREKYNET